MVKIHKVILGVFLTGIVFFSQQTLAQQAPEGCLPHTGTLQSIKMCWDVVLPFGAKTPTTVKACFEQKEERLLSTVGFKALPGWSVVASETNLKVEQLDKNPTCSGDVLWKISNTKQELLAQICAFNKSAVQEGALRLDTPFTTAVAMIQDTKGHTVFELRFAFKQDSNQSFFYSFSNCPPN